MKKRRRIWLFSYSVEALMLRKKNIMSASLANYKHDADYIEFIEAPRPKRAKRKAVRE